MQRPVPGDSWFTRWVHPRTFSQKLFGGTSI